MNGSIAGQKKKVQYHITLTDSKMRHMARGKNIFRDVDGSAYDVFVILTATAVGAVAEIHNRTRRNVFSDIPRCAQYARLVAAQ